MGFIIPDLYLSQAVPERPGFPDLSGQLDPRALKALLGCGVLLARLGLRARLDHRAVPVLLVRCFSYPLSLFECTFFNIF